jgi:release factor glutamine methyltransferase
VIIRTQHSKSVLDLCTGSAALRFRLQSLRKGFNGYASDVSAERGAGKGNAILTAWTRASVGSKRPVEKIPGTFDLIVCNPPYLTRPDMEHLQTEVAFEPRLAVFGGEDGLDIYRRIAEGYQAHLNPCGTLLLEIGSTQSESVSALFGQTATVFNDLCGNPRVIQVQQSE